MIIGTQIYYTGDMANTEGFGKITAVYPPSQYCPIESADIEMEDGRIFRKVFKSNFTPGPGRRFWYKNEWETERRKKLQALQERMKNIS